jgi:PAS domain S-box-containing protein
MVGFVAWGVWLLASVHTLRAELDRLGERLARLSNERQALDDGDTDEEAWARRLERLRALAIGVDREEQAVVMEARRLSAAVAVLARLVEAHDDRPASATADRVEAARRVELDRARAAIGGLMRARHERIGAIEERLEGYWDRLGLLVVVACVVAIGTVAIAAKARLDGDRRRRAEEALRASQERYYHVYNDSPLAFVVWGPHGRIVDWNRRAEELFGWTRAEMLGRTGTALIAEADRPRVRAALEELRRGGEPVVLVNTNLTKAGEPIVCEWHNAALHDADGRPSSFLATALDVTARLRAEADRESLLEAAVSSEARFRKLFESNLIGITVADFDGRITEANDAFLALVGYDRADLAAGRIRWDRLTPPEFSHFDVRAVAELRRCGRSAPYEKEYIHKDGHLVPIFIGAALFDPGKTSSVCFVLDMTERRRDELRRRRMEAELKESKEAAEAANRAKDRFLAVLSHELRTPLTPVLMAVDAALEADPETPLRPTLEVIRRNVGLEARLIDDLLDVSRIGRGALDLDLRVVDVHQIVRQAVEICLGAVEAASLRLTLELDAPEHHALGDRARLLQLFWNLIRNATKFVAAGGRLTIRSRAVAGPDGPRLVVEFEDDGIGIEPTALARIFDPFEQADATIRGRFGGLGLGLAIGRWVAEAHGGKLTATSPGPGLGSTFRLGLATVTPEPAAATPAPEPSPEPTAPAHAASRELKVLIVEDNCDTLNYLRLVVGRRGHEVVAASSIAEARAAVAEAGPFDLLLSDIELPDGTGHELARGGDVAAAAIAMSGFGSEDDVQQSLAAGFRAHLTKPIELARLDAAICGLAFEEVLSAE